MLLILLGYCGVCCCLVCVLVLFGGCVVLVFLGFFLVIGWNVCRVWLSWGIGWIWVCKWWCGWSGWVMEFLVGWVFCWCWLVLVCCWCCVWLVVFLGLLCGFCSCCNGCWGCFVLGLVLVCCCLGIWWCSGCFVLFSGRGWLFVYVGCWCWWWVGWLVFGCLGWLLLFYYFLFGRFVLFVFIFGRCWLWW